MRWFNRIESSLDGLEFFIALHFIVWGVLVGRNPSAMYDPIYASMVAMYSPNQWAWWMAVTGGIGMTSWVVNGSQSFWTKPARIATTILMAWTLFSIVKSCSETGAAGALAGYSVEFSIAVFCIINRTKHTYFAAGEFYARNR